MKSSVKIKFMLVLMFLLSLLMTFIYALDEIIMPRVLVTCDMEMRAEVTNIINKTIFQEYSNNFNYDELINIEKDKNGKIILMKADTLKLNNLSINTVLKAQEEIKEIGEVGIKIPVGYLSKNNILAPIGPKITIKMQPIGYIVSKYISEFESAGINQTRHKIYIETTTKMRLILPLANRDIEVINQIPIIETIIVGEVPDNAINMNLNDK